MALYLDNIVKYSIQPIDAISAGSLEAPPAALEQTDTEFAAKLAADSNAVAAKCQMHSMSHNATCFKYGAAVTGKCWFNFLCLMVERTNISKLGAIEVCRNNHLVNF